MAGTIIDRRKNGKGKSSVNRRKFVKRVKSQVREAMKDTIKNGSIKDIVDSKGKRIRIPGKGLKKPTFHHGKGGQNDSVHVGNKRFRQGDRINRPPGSSGGRGKKGSPEGEGEDSFVFEITRDEFLDMFFEDLELPDMVKKSFVKVDEYVHQRAGFSIDGSPSKLNLERSMRQAKGRRVGLNAGKKRKLKELIKKHEELTESLMSCSKDEVSDIEQQIEKLNDQILKIKERIKRVPFIDDIDLRYNRWEKVKQPITQAVMFGIMDVSASMGEWEKEMAKRFFMLMLLFLTKNYERVEIVWIRHHTIASEVEEDEFFHSQETGGTLVSTSLTLMKEIIAKRYPREQWNIFASQISDGDNWHIDNPDVSEIMSTYILPVCQYYCYVEVDAFGMVSRDSKSDLWPVYKGLQSNHKNLAMSVISDVTEIYPTFRGLFEKRGINK